jgi:hypothetical protein
MKLECQSCLLQFDADTSRPTQHCPRCGSSHVSAAPTADAAAAGPPAPGAPSARSVAIAPTIAQPMVAPYAPPPANPPSPFAQPVQAYGQPAPASFGAPAPQPPFGAPAPPFGAPAPQPPFGAPAPPFGAQPPPSAGASYGANPFAPPPMPVAYGAPQGAFGAPQGGFGAIPSGMAPYGPANVLLESEQRKAFTLSIISVLLIWPLAVAGFMLLQGSKEAAMRGDFATALQKSKTSQLMGWISVGIVAAVVVFACFLGMASG